MDNLIAKVKITEGGLCSQKTEYPPIKKELDEQLVAGFFYALNTFLNEYLGEKPSKLITDNYKIQFHPKNKGLTVTIEQKNNFSHQDYSHIKIKVQDDFEYLIE